MATRKKSLIPSLISKLANDADKKRQDNDRKIPSSCFKTPKPVSSKSVFSTPSAPAPSTTKSYREVRRSEELLKEENQQLKQQLHEEESQSASTIELYREHISELVNELQQWRAQLDHAKQETTKVIEISKAQIEQIEQESDAKVQAMKSTHTEQVQQLITQINELSCKSTRYSRKLEQLGIDPVGMTVFQLTESDTKGNVIFKSDLKSRVESLVGRIKSRKEQLSSTTRSQN
eukprot:TRINITY_DN2818_c0_g1_i1.p1 TRINITY_DN2818_c0_g1~~TRINITY_DN2818_c0_g1_i1.p1  ORF type:complete len:233 (+),score=28.76 TRINITY_DN2818_c0_g1_i1:92-790(+)